MEQPSATYQPYNRERRIRERSDRHDSVTDWCDRKEAETDNLDDTVTVDDEADKFEDEQETVSTTAALRVFHDEHLLEQILLHNAAMSTRGMVKDVLGAMRVDKTWCAAIRNSAALQRLMWFTPSLKHVPAQVCDKEKIFINFNPILWPVHPTGSTIEVTHSMLNTGTRGPGSWRKMLIASASQRRFSVIVKVERTRVAIVKCDAWTTVGKLLDMARLGTGQDDFDIFQEDEPKEEDFDCDFCVCVVEGLPAWQKCDECLRDGAP